MKKLLFILMALVGTVGQAFAQSYCYWGYGNSTVSSALGEQTSAKGAIYIPADVAKRYEGCTISKVRVGLSAKTSSLTVFVTKDLSADYAVSGTTTTAYKGTTEVKTTSAYTIDGEPFYVGYAYSGDNVSMGQCNIYNANGCWADLGDGWKNYAESDHVTALVVDAVITGTNLPVDANLLSTNGVMTTKGEAFTLTGTVKNQGPARISKMQIGVSVDGGTETVYDLSKLVITSGASKDFTIEVTDNPYAVGIHTVTYRIVSVNGEEDLVTDNNTATATLNVTGSAAVKRMVVEEGTGINCGWCPRGIVGLETMYEQHPNQFIGIALHSYSNVGPACPADYKTFASTYFSGYPTCRIQRQYTTDPRYSNLETYFKAATKNLNIGVEVEAKLSSDGKSIEAVATTTPLAVAANTEYQLAFVLTENDVTGYMQLNNYSGGGSGTMGGFENMDSYANINLQHVARATYGLTGIEGSLPTTLKENEVITYTRSLEIPSTVQTKANLNVVVLVLNMVTGEIENAAECKVGSSSTTAIDAATETLSPDVNVRVNGGTISVDGFNGTLQVYNVNGTAVSNQSLPHGIYVVKGTMDGKTFVKRIAF